MTTTDVLRLVSLYRQFAADADAMAAREGASEWRRTYYAGQADACRSCADILAAMAGFGARPVLLTPTGVRQECPADPTDSPALCVG